VNDDAPGLCVQKRDDAAEAEDAAEPVYEEALALQKAR